MFKISHLERIIFFSLLGALALGSVLHMAKILFIPLPETLPSPEREVSREVPPEPIVILEPEIPPPEPEVITPPPPKPAPPVPKEITIRVMGAVKNPGVYRFKEGAKVVDAVKAAGGPKEDALLDIMRLTQPLKEGSEIVVSSKFGAEEYRRMLLARKSGEVITTEDLIRAYGRPVPAEKEEAARAPAPAAASSKININTASQPQLETLPGIGPKRAEVIIAHRPYGSIEEITRVPGIGPKTYGALKDKITVE